MYPVNTWYTLNLHHVIGQLDLRKTGGKKEKTKYIYQEGSFSYSYILLFNDLFTHTIKNIFVPFLNTLQIIKVFKLFNEVGAPGASYPICSGISPGVVDTPARSDLHHSPWVQAPLSGSSWQDYPSPLVLFPRFSLAAQIVLPRSHLPEA